jgi:O-antigen ligase
MICKITTSLYISSTILLSHYGWGTKYNKLMAAFCFTAVIVDRFTNKKKLIEFSTQHIIFICWCILATLSGLIAGQWQDALDSAKRLLIIFFASLPIYMVLVDRNCFKWIGWTIVLSAIASNATIVFGVLPPLTSESASRFGGTLENPNLFAFVSLTGLVSLTYLWRVHHRRLLKVFIFLAGTILSYQIIISGSRKGIIGVFLILLLQYAFFALKNRKKVTFKRSVGGLIAISILLSGFGYFVAISDSGSRMRNMMLFFKGENPVKERSITNRAFLADIGFKRFLENPIIGTGLSSFADTKLGIGVYSRSIGTYSHSNMIEILVSSGVIGFFLYYAIYFTCFLQLSLKFKSNIDEKNRHLLYFSTTSVAVLLFYEFLAVTYYGKEFWIFLSCLFASIKILKNRSIT